MKSINRERIYRNIFILESRSWWGRIRDVFDVENDLVLTYDFGLKRDIEELGGQVLFFDHQRSCLVMHENNSHVYKFFREWHLDEGGKDIFEYRSVSFGFSFRLEIWNDLISYVRTRISLEILRDIQYRALFVGTELGLVESTLSEMGLSFRSVSISKARDGSIYFFPIHSWIDQKIRYKWIGGVKYKLRDLAGSLQGMWLSFLDCILWERVKKPFIFVQEYYPTYNLVKRLYRDNKVRLVLASFSRGRGWFRYIPIVSRIKKYHGDANELIRRFHLKRHAKLIVLKDVDISKGAYQIIEARISACIAKSMRDLDCVINYFDKNPIKLEVLIANIGQIAPIVDCVCKSRHIPSYLIINGLLVNDFQDESKYASIINSYSVSIKENYFCGLDNVVCLGDPRMDAYANKFNMQRKINREAPTITIGASGYNGTDLNSYLAVEFDFLFDVLQAIRIVNDGGIALSVVIKVRANGYREQYEAFVNEYFPGLVSEIMDSMPMNKVFEKTDFFISIYSQTLFEASCLGIPCLYYKKDTEIIHPPFDGYSELVTVDSVDDLVQAIFDFRSTNPRYNRFLEKSVMEKYIGPLDGNNLDRNLDFIYSLLNQSDVETLY